MSAPPVLWCPGPVRVESAALTAYVRWLEATRGLELPDYASLWEWSTRDLEGFWGSVWERFDVVASAPYERVLGSREMPGAEWFPGARLNLRSTCSGWADADAVALRHASESQPLREVTRDELRGEVARLAGGLRALGVGAGRSGGRVPAERSRGGGGVSRLRVDRGHLVELLAGFRRPERDRPVRPDRAEGRCWPWTATATGAGTSTARPSWRSCWRRCRRSSTRSFSVVLERDPAPAGPPGAIGWSELRSLGEGAQLVFEQLPFAHPLWVLYSSGTTGLPKAIVHGHGGILLEMLKTMHLHLDLGAKDRLFWFTTTGWMMWNFLVGGLLSGASIVLYDGSPGSPDLGVLWDLAETAGVTCFGTGAAYLSSCQKASLRPAEGRDLSALRSVGSTGSPLSPDGFSWVYGELGDVWLFSMSGGTDLCTAFVGGVPTLPVYRGELQARALGARVEAWSPDGRSLVGEVGELVLTEPMPSMPLCFWGDADGSRYRESYFEMFPGVWRHGDWIEITDRGTAVISGRSDATINRGGVRMGTSEIYRAVLALDEVVDALVLDLPLPGTDGFMPLFVVLREGVDLDDDLVARIRGRIREDCSPRHVPDRWSRSARCRERSPGRRSSSR